AAVTATRIAGTVDTEDRSGAAGDAARPRIQSAALRLSRVPPGDRRPPTADRGPQTLLAIARDFSTRIMRVGEGEVLLDVGGLGRLIGDPPAIARELRRAIADAEADAAVAIAPTQTMARLLAAEGHDYPIERFAEIPVAR